EYALAADDLVIADQSGPVAIAGVMGGAASEVTATTTELLLEVAWFDPRRVRRGSRALELSTEASKRYERGVDPEIGPAAAARFLALLKEIMPGAAVGASRERRANMPAPRTIALRASRITRLVGHAFSAREAAGHLAAFEFPTRKSGGDALHVTVPSWRPDVGIEDDLVEEVARAWGYDRIPEAPLETRGVHAERTVRERRNERARAAMLARGFSEAWTSSLVSRDEAVATAALLDGAPPRLLALANPMNPGGAVLRPNPIAGLLRAVAHNLRQGMETVRLFEIGAGYVARDGALPDEPALLAAVAVGPRFAHAHDAAQQAMDFADAKGVWEAWLDEMRVDTPSWRTYSAAGWKPGASAEVAIGTSRIGWAGTLGRQLLRAWDIEVPEVHLFVVRLDAMPPIEAARSGVNLPGRFPPVRRDLAFFVPEAVTHEQLASALRGAAGERLVSLELFDVYAGHGTPEHMKGLAYALRFQHPERTLTEAEIQTIQDRMTAAAAKTLGARLRER
ncbi:MAG: phenylalanine--tRNA ligase subunit beta, partial [Candidatus Eisenbacteria bacterium]|nr:phenylalanine--tRNA ligase subunit beta [Candidatus Eisenbacteria bacterium]